MSITPGHLVINTLQDLSRAVSRAGARDPSKDFTRIIPNPSKAYALGGLGIAASGKDAPAPVRFGAITINPRPTGTLLGLSPGVHQAVGRAYDNPGVRFGDRSKGSARPLSADGAQTFHFSHSYYSKTSPILEMIKATRGGRHYWNSKATDHLLYIERDGAAEKIGKEKEYPGYDPDVEGDEFERLERDAAGRSAQNQQDYLERPGAVERTPVHDLSDDELDKLEYASFGNIGDTLEERRYFWNALEKVEQDPQGDEVKIKFADYPELWGLAIQNLASAPSQLKKVLEAQAASGEPADFRKKLPTKNALEIHNWVAGLDPEAPIEIGPGRGGRIQNRIIAELPFELEGRERVEIVRNFTKKLTEKGLPFWAVIHAPDDNNDRRNYHVHIIYADRPAARMKDPNDPNGPLKWDFEITERKRFPNRHWREVYPYLQNKLPEVSVGRESDTWVPILRERWKDVSNEVMEKAGVIKRYDARSYEAMGIQLDPLKHIPSKTFNKERKGELTEDGVVLARRQWQVMQDRLVADHGKRAQHRQRKLKETTGKAKAVMGSQSPYKDIALKEVDRLTKIIERLGYRISTQELFQDLTRLVVDRVASRPKLIIDADIKKNEKSPGRTKAKGGQGHGQTTQAPEDKNGATPPVGRAAKEAMTFLLEVFGHAIHMDRRTGAEIKVARSQLNILLKRLENMMADPKRHPLDRRSPGFIDLDVVDPGPEVMAARKQERMERITNRLVAYVEASVPKILSEVTGRSASKTEPNKGNITQVSVPSQSSEPRTETANREPILVNREAARASINRSVSDRASPLPPSASQSAPAKTANAEPVSRPVSAPPQEPVVRPQKTRFRPEPFYKPKEKVAAPAKNPAASPVESPAQAPVNSAAKAPVRTNPRTEAAHNPAAAGNFRQPVERAVNNKPNPANTAPGIKPARDNAGAAAPKSAATPPAPAAPAAAQRPAAAPTSSKPAQPQLPSRPVQAPPPPAARTAAPQAGSTKEPAPAKTTSAPAAAPAPAKAPTQAPVQTTPPHPEPARTGLGPATGTGKPDTAKTASGAKTAARPEKVSVAPKPSAAPSGPTRIPGERSGENLAVQPAKEEVKIRVGDPISPVASKPIEPIRVEEEKQPKKPKRRIKGRDDDLGM